MRRDHAIRISLFELEVRIPNELPPISLLPVVQPRSVDRLGGDDVAGVPDVHDIEVNGEASLFC